MGQFDNANTGEKNNGYWNTGDYNAGQGNAGDMNRGDGNTGDFNVGTGNTGSKNTGDYNAGFYNRGSFNTGDWNACHHSSGIFCNLDEKIRFFNKPSDLTYQEWIRSDACRILRRVQTARWRAADRQLLHTPLQDACREMWRLLSQEERAVIKRLPNFDPSVFFEITGIDCRS